MDGLHTSIRLFCVCFLGTHFVSILAIKLYIKLPSSIRNSNFVTSCRCANGNKWVSILARKGSFIPSLSIDENFLVEIINQDFRKNLFCASLPFYNCNIPFALIIFPLHILQYTWKVGYTRCQINGSSKFRISCKVHFVLSMPSVWIRG